MNENGFASRGDGAFAMSGQLTFQTVPQFHEHAGDLFKNSARPVTIDMRGVTLADSAGLALMIEWLQSARAAQREIVFTNIPDQMHDLIRVNGLTRVFALK